KFVIDSELDPDNPRATNEKLFFSFTKEIVDKYESYFVGEYYTGDFNGQLEKVYYINVGEENKAKFSELICIPQNIILDYSADYLSMNDEVVSYNGIWINPMAYGQENAYKTRALCIMFLDPRVNSNVSLYIENYKGSEKGDADCKGDANCDGNVNMADAVLIMQSLANPDKYGVNGTDDTHITAQGEFNGDMDGNGLTNADALAIQRKMLNLD
ncbi:MAG: dockerin type I repeat-containing protein, partial [Ruminococcus sp.]|nr:dockerin type I repeat-containing protein [Ruminococcus sp.]